MGLHCFQKTHAFNKRRVKKFFDGKRIWKTRGYYYSSSSFSFCGCCCFSYQDFPFRGLSIISSVRYFFVEVYQFKNICQMEIFLLVYLQKECLLNKQSLSRCKVSLCSKEYYFKKNFTLAISVYYFQIYILFDLLLRTNSIQRVIGCQICIRKG